MFSIGLGLLLYYVLRIVFFIVLVMVLVPFMMNIGDGRGFGFNFKLVWGGFWKFLMFGIKKRTKDEIPG